MCRNLGAIPLDSVVSCPEPSSANGTFVSPFWWEFISLGKIVPRIECDIFSRVELVLMPLTAMTCSSTIQVRNEDCFITSLLLPLHMLIQVPRWWQLDQRSQSYSSSRCQTHWQNMVRGFCHQLRPQSQHDNPWRISWVHECHFGFWLELFAVTASLLKTL